MSEIEKLKLNEYERRVQDAKEQYEKTRKMYKQ